MGTLREVLRRVRSSAQRAPGYAGPGDRIGYRELATEMEFLPGEFWHSTDAHPTNFLFNNVWMDQGSLESMSAVKRKHGDRLITLGDLYPLAGQRAEAVWEDVRARDYPDKPSRRGALFLFVDRAATTNASHWRPDNKRAVLKVRVFRHANVHQGDLDWFGCREEARYEAAAAYWSGDPASTSPAWELIVDGQVFFPAWRDPPFRPAAGKKTGQSPKEIVTCPACGIEFHIVSPNATIFTSAHRPRCLDDPDPPILNDCPHVAALVESA